MVMIPEKVAKISDVANLTVLLIDLLNDRFSACFFNKRLYINVNHFSVIT